LALCLGSVSALASATFDADCRALSKGEHRLTGTKNYEAAVDYIVKRLAQIGVPERLNEASGSAERFVVRTGLVNRLIEADGGLEALNTRLAKLAASGQEHGGEHATLVVLLADVVMTACGGTEGMVAALVEEAGGAKGLAKVRGEDEKELKHLLEALDGPGGLLPICERLAEIKGGIEPLMRAVVEDHGDIKKLATKIVGRDNDDAHEGRVGSLPEDLEPQELLPPLVASLVQRFTQFQALEKVIVRDKIFAAGIAGPGHMKETNARVAEGDSGLVALLVEAVHAGGELSGLITRLTEVQPDCIPLSAATGGVMGLTQRLALRLTESLCERLAEANGGCELIVQPFPTVQTQVKRCEMVAANGKSLPLLHMRPNGIIPPVTPPEGVTARLVDVGAGRIEDFATVSVQGAIVVLSYNAEGWSRAFRLGARAVVFVKDGICESRHPHYLE
ncbi:MAG: hypothetical protein KAI66_27205, partial [Lentisphaeria bacterium]|nr:hypothetical protein [Lentisphaeria bacterium]